MAPKVVIPMHFKNDRCPGFPVAGVEDFTKGRQQVKVSDSSEAEIKKFFGAESQMRGLYRRDTAAIGLMRRVRGWLAGSGAARGGRWHDQRPKGGGA